MSQSGVRQVIGRMISDPAFASAVHADSQKAITEAGYHLTNDEIASVGKLKPSDLVVNMRPGHGGSVGIWEVSSVKG